MFWLDPGNWYWESGMYSEASKEYLYRALVYPAQKEALKRNKQDSILWKLGNVN